jgi:hypothetical protein
MRTQPPHWRAPAKAPSAGGVAIVFCTGLLGFAATPGTEPRLKTTLMGLDGGELHCRLVEKQLVVVVPEIDGGPTAPRPAMMGVCQGPFQLLKECFAELSDYMRDTGVVPQGEPVVRVLNEAYSPELLRTEVVVAASLSVADAGRAP